MKTTLLPLFALAALPLLNSGCQHGGAYAPVNTTKYNYESTANFVTMDPGAQRSVTSPGIQTRILPDGRLVSVGRDRTIRMWSTEGKPKEVSAPFDALTTKVVARYDSKLVIAGDYQGRLQLWDGRLSATIDP